MQTVLESWSWESNKTVEEIRAELRVDHFLFDYDLSPTELALSVPTLLWGADIHVGDGVSSIVISKKKWFW